MLKLFVSYRRIDSVQVTGRIYDRLTAEFGRENVFKDVDSIPLGTDFRKVLNGSVAQCDVFIAVIGREWLEIKDEQGQRRIDQATDFVRTEVEAALQRDIPVIPVLVDDAKLPSPEELPDSIRNLTYRSAISVGIDPDFHNDVNRLIAGINAISPHKPEPVDDPPVKKPRKKRKWLAPVAATVLFGLLGAGAYNFWPDKSAGTTEQTQINQEIKPPAQATIVKSDNSATKAKINELLKKAQTALDKHELHAPAGANVVYYAEQILKADPGNAEAQKLLQSVVSKYHGWVRNNIQKDEFKTAASYLRSSRTVIDDFELIDRKQENDQLSAQLDNAKALQASRLAEEKRAAEVARKAEQARVAEEQRQAQLEKERTAKRLAEQKRQAFLKSTIKLDNDLTLVPIPKGSFMMGSNKGNSDERPVHKVTIDYPFWMSTTEITFAQYDAYAAASKNKPEDQGWGRGSRPVINVNWHEAQGFVNWISAKNTKGLQCRLPSEAEWEYAARAKPNADKEENTKYSWGNEIGRNNASCDGCGSKWGWDAEKKTAPTGSFKPNKFGLYDMHGNVWEWVQDNWHDSYQNAPNDGSVWQGGDAKHRVLRGGSWVYAPLSLRSANRSYHGPGNRNRSISFRIVCSPSSVR